MKRSLAVLDDVKIQGRVPTIVGLRQEISIPPSPEGGLTVNGTKCEHGVYIPSTHRESHRAPYCSLCNLYRVTITADGIYKG
jgi:hypothetical protein